MKEIRLGFDIDSRFGTFLVLLSYVAQAKEWASLELPSKVKVYRDTNLTIDIQTTIF